MTTKNRLLIKNHINFNGIVVYSLTLAWIFFVIYTTSDKASTIYVMNAFLFGNIISLFITYARYIFYVIRSEDRYTRARQFALSTGVVWLAILVFIVGSIVRHSSNTYNIDSTSLWDLLGRYLAIIAATMQILAPSYGESIFYGVERKLLVAGTVIGFISAAIVIIFQAMKLLQAV